MPINTYDMSCMSCCQKSGSGSGSGSKSGGGSGSGSGSGGSGSMVTSPCCAGVGIPTVLHLTITNVSGCACLAGTYTLIYSASAGGWVTAPFTLCTQPNSTIGLTCVANSQWAISGTGLNNTNMTKNSCNPIDLTASGVLVSTPALCNGTINYHVTT